MGMFLRLIRWMQDRSTTFEILEPIRNRLNFGVQRAEGRSMAFLTQLNGGRPLVKFSEQGSLHLLQLLADPLFYLLLPSAYRDYKSTAQPVARKPPLRRTGRTLRFAFWPEIVHRGETENPVRVFSQAGLEQEIQKIVNDRGCGQERVRPHWARMSMASFRGTNRLWSGRRRVLRAIIGQGTKPYARRSESSLRDWVPKFLADPGLTCGAIVCRP